MDRDIRLKRLRFRAWHRGTREADYMIGGFLDAHGERWGEAEIAWYEAFLEEQDVNIMAWAMARQEVPARWRGELMVALQRLDYIQVAR